MISLINTVIYNCNYFKPGAIYSFISNLYKKEKQNINILIKKIKVIIKYLIRKTIKSTIFPVSNKDWKGRRE